MFNRINGRQTLAEIAQSVAEQLGWEPDRAWTHTRALFEILARQLAAVPKNSPELDAEHAPESGI